MISVQDALSLVKKNSFPLRPVKVQLEEAYNLILAEDVSARYDIPAFAQSSMDGYAFSFSGWQKAGKLSIEGEIPAGSAVNLKLKPDQAARIFTGAVVPDGTDTVVMQEKVSIENKELKIDDPGIAAGNNVREAGSEIKKGEIALAKDSKLSPAAVGFLAGIGTGEVVVYPRPFVSIIVTGNELQSPGTRLRKGQVFESSSFALKAALRSVDMFNAISFHAKDDRGELINKIKQALNLSNLVLIAGGISVGDYDYVLESLTSCGISEVFYKVKQKPGKPLFFGKNDKSLVFGLPGNPSSVLTCFYEYVIPAIEIMSAHEKLIQVAQCRLNSDFKKNRDLTFFLKGFREENEVTPLAGQESYRMRSFAKANCLIKLDEGVENYLKGEEVEVHLLPD